MKKNGLLVLIGSLVLSTSSYAFEGFVDQCHTLDGKTHVLISKTRPMGFLAQEVLSAIIVEGDTPVGGISNIEKKGTDQVFYVDKRTDGDRFILIMPSPSKRYGSVKAIFGDNELLIDEYLECADMTDNRG